MPLSNLPRERWNDSEPEDLTPFVMAAAVALDCGCIWEIRGDGTKPEILSTCPDHRPAA